MSRRPRFYFMWDMVSSHLLSGCHEVLELTEARHFFQFKVYNKFWQRHVAGGHSQGTSFFEMCAKRDLFLLLYPEGKM